MVADIVGRVGCTLRRPARGYPVPRNLRRPRGAGSRRGAPKSGSKI